MLKNIVDKRTQAIVLKRTNYGEADRILNLITPDGKVSAMARGVRKTKSKLAGGVEMLALVEVNLHFGRGELATVTGAKGLQYYRNILKDYNRMELAALMLKKINMVAEGTESAEYFELLREGLDGLDVGLNLALVESWFLLNLLKVTGEEVNLYRDVEGKRLEASMSYDYNVSESSFQESSGGAFGANEIKMLRLMTTMRLAFAARVKGADEILPGILRLTRIVSKMM